MSLVVPVGSSPANAQVFVHQSCVSDEFKVDYISFPIKKEICENNDLYQNDIKLRSSYRRLAKLFHDARISEDYENDTRNFELLINKVYYNVRGHWSQCHDIADNGVEIYDRSCFLERASKEYNCELNRVSVLISTDLIRFPDVETDRCGDRVKLGQERGLASQNFDEKAAQPPNEQTDSTQDTALDNSTDIPEYMKPVAEEDTGYEIPTIGNTQNVDKGFVVEEYKDNDVNSGISVYLLIGGLLVTAIVFAIVFLAVSLFLKGR